MAIDIDASSPALATQQSDTVTTASFTRPAGAVLVATVMGLSDTAFTVSGGGLTWTRRAQIVDNIVQRVEIWTAPVTGSGSMTVTANASGEWETMAIKVDAATGQHPTAYIGQTNTGTATTNPINVTGYVSSDDGSRGFFGAIDGNGLGNPTVQDGDTGFPWNITSFGTSGIAIRKATNTPTAGTNVTFSADAPGTGGADWAWAALEILPTSLGAEVTAETVAVAAAVPAPAATASASRTPATVTAAATVPGPAVSAGVHAHPSTIAVAAALPPPTVTTEETETVVPPTVTVVVALPAPAASVAAARTLAAVAATVAMPPPSVSASVSVTLPTVAVDTAMPAPAVTVPVLPGDQITRPGQVEWRGTLLGSGTPYSWQELQGWRDSPPIISGNVDQPLGHGSYPGQPYAGERIINWATLLKAPRDQVGQLVRDLIMATGVPQSEEEGYLVIWDFDDDQPYLVQAHLTNRQPGPVNRQARLGLMRGALQWTASDPRLYSVIRHSATIPINVETAILNDGNDSSPAEFRIPGPVTTPQIENLTTDRVIGFNLTVAAGETLVIDVKNGNVTIGDANKLSTLIDGSTSVKDFVLGAGSNRLYFTAEAGGTVMEALWRHALS
ncbi:hypothetical protein ACBI99_44655 [Nonomuraea sp. ATR24]|uniref:phage distal tail protein n=1 Tax=Nonomuraea sp. ATR24 TaxID=1676744 RepID=UPI0035C24370